MDNRLKHFKWVGEHNLRDQTTTNNIHVTRVLQRTECGFKVLGEITAKFLQI